MVQQNQRQSGGLTSGFLSGIFGNASGTGRGGMAFNQSDIGASLNEAGLGDLMGPIQSILDEVAGELQKFMGPVLGSFTDAYGQNATGNPLESMLNMGNGDLLRNMAQIALPNSGEQTPVPEEQSAPAAAPPTHLHMGGP